MRFEAAPAGTGPWSAVSYDPDTWQSTLTDSGATWVAGELVGLFVQPDAADPRLYPIVDNTATSIVVWGDVASWIPGLGAGINTAKVRLGESVAVIGIGGVGLNAIQGIRCLKPESTFYAFTNISSLGLSSWDFSKYLAKSEVVGYSNQETMGMSLPTFILNSLLI